MARAGDGLGSKALSLRIPVEAKDRILNESRRRGLSITQFLLQAVDSLTGRAPLEKS